VSARVLISRELTSAAAQEKRAEPRNQSVRGDGVAVRHADTVGANPPLSTEVTVKFVLDPLLEGIEREPSGKVAPAPTRAGDDRPSKDYPKILQQEAHDDVQHSHRKVLR
jgi:hypothetical protein